MHPDSITEAEIHAYLDGELDLVQRLAVEQHLARNPDAAARFMADLEMRTSLRMMASNLDEIPAGMLEAANRLSARIGALSTRRLRAFFDRRVIRVAAAAALLAVIVVPGRNVLASPPGYVGDAVEAYHTGLLRATMNSQIEAPRFDAKEVQRTTRIRVPRLPALWVVTDAQIFPTNDGPALQLMVSTPDDEKMSIFAVRSPSEAPHQPTAVRHDGASVAYWREGDMSYALTGEAAPEAMDSVAENIVADNT